MDPTSNPFAPGAGTQPPELAGRSGIITDAEVALARAVSGRGKSALFLGLRGVGKTVLLNRIGELAESSGALTVFLEAPEEQSLAAMLVPPLRSALFRLSTSARAGEVAKKALGVLRAFATVFKAKVGEIEFGVKPELGTADSGDLEHDLTALLAAVTTAARAEGVSLVLLLDELQYLSRRDLSALIVAAHRLGQKGAPFVIFAAGLPQLAALAGEAKSYAERLFDFPNVGPLSPEAARTAIRAPLGRHGVEVTDEALDHLIEHTRGYPYFLQEWGYQAWNVAVATPIRASDVKLATLGAIERLDAGFFKVRFDRLTPKEREYMRAMATLGPGPHRSGEVARAVGKDVKSVAPVRDGLIKKGMLFSPHHGETAFTVPMFDAFMKRVMPAADEKPRKRRQGPRARS
jgi:hypothetical protein